jgi:hypothetical protein
MLPLWQYVHTQAKNWWATPVINQFLILLSFIFALLFGMQGLMPGNPPDVDWGDLFMPLYLIFASLSSALEANRTPTSER